MRTLSFYILILALAGTGCKKGYFDLNDNPNQVTVPTLQGLLSTATHKTGINSYNVGSITSVHVQYTANPGASAATDTYQIVDYTGTWDAIYFALADIHDLQQLAIQRNATEYLGVANVLLSYNLTLAADLWGSVPYSSAFDPKNLTPEYDVQKQVYDTCVALLDAGLVELNKTTGLPKLDSTKDLIHRGGRARWIKTAYALKARLLNKISKTPAYDPAAVLAALDKSYTTNGDDAGMAYFQNRNNWAGVAVANASNTLGGWLSEQLIDHLNGTSYGLFDPRIQKITDTTVKGIYIGTVNGAGNRPPANNTVKDENYISVSSPWTSETAPLLLVTFAELKFVEAEASLASDPTRAYNAYLAGIRANMDRLQVDPAKRNAYLDSPQVKVGAANLTKALIFKEKYVATYLNPEAWNDARRNDYLYKNFTLPANAVLTTFIRRLAYPVGETSKNSANVPPVESLTDRLWWDL